MPQTAVKPENLPQFTAPAAEPDLLTQALAQETYELRDKIKLDGCRSFWRKYPQKMAAIPELTHQACEVFKKKNCGCENLGRRIYQLTQMYLPGRGVRRLFAGRRMGMIRPSEIEVNNYLDQMQNSLIIGITSTIVSFMPQEYWEYSLGQPYDYSTNVDIENQKMYDYVCDKSLPVLEEVLKDFINTELYVDGCGGDED